MAVANGESNLGRVRLVLRRALPEVAQAWGVGFAGPIVLWIGNVRLVQRGATQLKFDASSMLP